MSDNDGNAAEIRDKSIALLAKYLEGEGSERALKLAEEVEKTIFEEFGSANDHRYRSRIRSRISNLSRNPKITQLLLQGSLCPEKFAKMSPEELATPELRELRDKLAGEAMDEHMLPELEVPRDDNFKKSENAV